MLVPTSELSWIELIRSNSELRKLQPRVSSAQMWMIVDAGSFVIFPRVSLADFRIYPISLTIPTFTSCSFFLEVFSYVNSNRTDVWSYPVTWKSRYRKNSSEFRLTVRPNAVYLTPHVLPRESKEGLLTIPHGYSGLAFPISLVGPLHDKLDSLITYSRSKTPYRSRSSASGLNRQPFGFRNKLPNPQVITVKTYFARFLDGDPSIISDEPPYDCFRRSYVSTVTPGFRNLRKSSLPENPYSLSVSRVANDPSYKYFNYLGSHPRNRYYFGTSGHLFNIANPSFDSNRRNRTVAKAIDAIGRGINANFAQNFAQIHQLKNLIGSTAGKLTSSLSQLKRGNLYQAALSLYSDPSLASRQAKRLHSYNPVATNWLQLQYGWKPLLNDIDGLFRTLSNLVIRDEGDRNISAIRVRSSKKDEFQRTADSPIVSGGIKPTLYVTEVQSCSITLKWALESPLISFLSQTGFTNPVNLAWEILPFSFVFDWFLPIGPYLETLSGFHGLAFHGGSLTQTVRLNQSGLYSDRRLASGSLQEQGGSYSSEEFRLVREKLLSFPTASIPRFKDPFSVSHALNALALLQSFRRIG